MNLSEIPSWILPAVCGTALRLTLAKKFRFATVTRAIVQGICIGYIVKEVCVLKDWVPYISIYCAASAYTAEWILQTVSKNPLILFNRKATDESAEK